jgi:hypothetical protein
MPRTRSPCPAEFRQQIVALAHYGRSADLAGYSEAGGGLKRLHRPTHLPSQVPDIRQLPP